MTGKRVPLLRCWALIGFLFCTAGELARPQDRPSEYDVESAYLFNFGRFIHYPEDPSTPRTFNICLVGGSPIASILQKITLNEQVASRPVHIAQFERAADARNCAVVFLGDAEGAHIERDLAALDTSNALTVSAVPQFVEHGGMIQFVVENNRVRFAVNLNAVNRAHLQLSSELLKVAVYVNSKAGGGDR